LIDELLTAPIKVTFGGEEKIVPRLEAILMQLAQKQMAGSAPSHQNDCGPHHRVLIAPVSGSRLWKMGIFGVFARDFRRFSLTDCRILEYRDRTKICKKPRVWRAFSAFSAALSPVE
jgi:hypothetical protein